MKRQWRFLMAIVICWLGLTSLVQAKVDPYVEDPAQDWGDISNPVPVWSSTALVAHFGRLDPAGDVDAFAFQFAQPTSNWSVSVLIPVCASYFGSFYPRMALIGSGLERPAATVLPFNLPDGMGAVVFDTREVGSARPQGNDNLGVQTYSAPVFTANIPQKGTYVVAVWDAEQDIAPYILATGSKADQFANRSQTEREAAFGEVFSGRWMHQDCRPLTPTPLPLTPTGHISSAAPMTTARAAHTATLLKNGKLLITGGIARDGVFLKSAELYDPVSGLFSATGDMTAARATHTATLLTDGKVLIVAGDYQGKLVSAELYDPEANTFTATGSVHTARDGFRATLLADGKVLITGMGLEGGASAEVYDPAIGVFTVTGDMNTPRNMHTATVLPSGKVLIAGGMDGQGQVLAKAEVYDPATGIFTPIENRMTVKRHKQAAILLNDGRVLIMGGADESDWEGRRRTAEIYDPVAGLFTPTGAMRDPRFKFDDAIAGLPDGDVLVGGASKRPRFTIGLLAHSRWLRATWMANDFSPRLRRCRMAVC